MSQSFMFTEQNTKKKKKKSIRASHHYMMKINPKPNP